MDETKFEIGELVWYPVFDSSDTASLCPGVIIELDEDEDAIYVDERLSACRLYRIMGEHTEEESWFYSWEIMKFNPSNTPE